MAFEKDEHETPIMFRKSQGVVTAVFVAEPYDIAGRYLPCYEHIGQHGSCAWGWVQETKPAKPEEYAALLRELEGIGYRVKVVAKRTKAHVEAFNAQVSRLRGLRNAP